MTREEIHELYTKLRSDVSPSVRLLIELLLSENEELSARMDKLAHQLSQNSSPPSSDRFGKGGRSEYRIATLKIRAYL